MPPSVESTIATLNQVDLESVGGDNDARSEIIAAARRMVARLETPFEQAWRWSSISFNVFSVLQITMDLGLWEGWRNAGGQEATLEELLDVCKISCDLMLLRRLLRLMTAVHLVEEVGQDCYRPTPFSLALGDTSGTVAQTILSGTFHGLDSARNLPQFLARTSYQEPLDPGECNYMDLTPEEGLSLFARCRTDPKYQASFIGFMAGFSEMKVDWTDVYDTGELLEGYNKGSDDILLVDIAGGQGVDIIRFLNRYPKIPAGRLVLQDLPDVVAMFKGDPKIRRMAYDFFEPQPLIGCRAYFLHAVIHDWDDIDARRILKRITAAMKRGYSKLLLYESFLPSTGATVYQTVVDISLMHLMSSAERSELRWRLLLESADLKVTKIWKHPSSVESIMEAELA